MKKSDDIDQIYQFDDEKHSLINWAHLSMLFNEDNEKSKAKLSIQLTESRKALESFIGRLKEIWDFSVPPKSDPDQIAALIQKRQYEIMGKSDSKLIFEHLRTIGRYGNVGSHYQESEMNDIDLYIESVTICQLAWQGLIKWSQQIISPNHRFIPICNLENKLSSIHQVQKLTIFHTDQNRKTQDFSWPIKLLIGYSGQVEPNHTFNLGDKYSLNWELCSFAHIKSNHYSTTRNTKLITWRGINKYHDRGIRVSYINPSAKKYRHALLVEEEYGETIFKAMPARKHSIVTLGRFLILGYSNDQSLRIFDLQSVYKSNENKSKSLIGKGNVIEGHIYAFNYRYIIPQIMNFYIKNELICLGESFEEDKKSYAILKSTSKCFYLYSIEIDENDYFRMKEVVVLSSHIDWEQTRGFTKQKDKLFILLGGVLFHYSLNNMTAQAIKVSKKLIGFSFDHSSGQYQTIFNHIGLRSLVSFSNDVFEKMNHDFN